MLEINTYSIVARCERSGELGVAVATAVPAVGSMCPYLMPGVGAVSTQSWVNPYLAIDLLQSMQCGETAPAALREVLSRDPQADLRQVGVIGREGPGVSWTGSGCTEWRGDITGADFAIQGNMLVGKSTLVAMREAWLGTAALPLAERLMQVLEAGDAAGGDMRGKQSAALKVVGHEAYAQVDLRVDEHAEPVAELRRVLQVAERQLFPFVQGMPRRRGISLPLPAETTAMLLLPPSRRPR